MYCKTICNRQRAILPGFFRRVFRQEFLNATCRWAMISLVLIFLFLNCSLGRGFHVIECDSDAAVDASDALAFFQVTDLCLLCVLVFQPVRYKSKNFPESFATDGRLKHQCLLNITVTSFSFDFQNSCHPIQVFVL